jgi:hypothetical protein
MLKCSSLKNKHVGLTATSKDETPSHPDSLSNQLACAISPLVQDLKASLQMDLRLDTHHVYLLKCNACIFRRMAHKEAAFNCKDRKVFYGSWQASWELLPRELPTTNFIYPKAEVTHVATTE